MEGVTTDSIVDVLINRTFIFEKPHSLPKHTSKQIQCNPPASLKKIFFSFFKYCLNKTTPILVLCVSTE